MKHLAWVVVLACLVPTACTLSDERESSPDTTAVELAPAPPRPGLERRTAIYASVIRQLVEDHPYGNKPDVGFKVVYVLDGALEGAEKTLLREPPPEERFSTEVKTGLQDDLGDLPDLVFVRDRLSVLRKDGRVRNRGVLLTLGPIERKKRRAEVGTNLWVAGKGAIWQTYVVKHRASRWVVTGTTGWMAVS